MTWFPKRSHFDQVCSDQAWISVWYLSVRLLRVSLFGCFQAGFLSSGFWKSSLDLICVCFELELQDGMYLGTLFRKRWVQIAFCSDKAGSSSSKHIISPTFCNGWFSYSYVACWMPQAALNRAPNPTQTDDSFGSSLPQPDSCLSTYLVCLQTKQQRRWKFQEAYASQRGKFTERQFVNDPFRFTKGTHIDPWKRGENRLTELGRWDLHRISWLFLQNDWTRSQEGFYKMIGPALKTEKKILQIFFSKQTRSHAYKMTLVFTKWGYTRETVP